MGIKSLKDPIYGYIQFDANIFKDIVDTACFQRLRNIRQTSYGPLYSAALHNRFVHSLGVYHLGIIAFNAIKKKAPQGYCEQEFLEFCKHHEKLFNLACLLHDVGHAPFSHSGEDFYIMPRADELYKRLIEDVNESSFTKDASSYNRSKPAAPHEIMSAIVALEQFKNLFEDGEQRAFFARCITGYKYQNITQKENSLKNCIISMLNSSLIDVDRLDYLIRDSAVTGFENVLIDYTRLLDSLLIVYNEEESRYELAYHKGAISVIENVIYAHDAERKWIQNHPVVQYEQYLIRYAIRRINDKFRKDAEKQLFCVEALTEEGLKSERINNVSLLCDDDIVFLIKNVYPDSLTKEYFSRKDRRHPIWKSESEYRALFDQKLGPESLDKMETEFVALEKYLNLKAENPLINDKTLEICRDELEKAQKEDLGSDSMTIIKGFKTHIKWMECLKEASTSAGIPFDYVLIGTNKFKSGFMKEELNKIPIQFSNLDRVKSFGDVVTPLISTTKRDNFFYLYYNRGEKELEICKIVKCICDTAIS